MKKLPLIIGLFTMGLFMTACDNSSSSSESAKGEEKGNKEEVASSAEGTYVVDIGASTVNWKGTMMGMYSHSGILKFSEGKLKMKDGQIMGGTFVVDMNSMSPTDDNYDPEEGRSKDKLVEHLKSDDFFLVSEHPTATFAIGAVKDNKAVGKMTIRGNTNEVEVNIADVHAHEGDVHITGSAVLDRQAYDVQFSHPAEEMVLSDDLEIEVDIMAVKK